MNEINRNGELNKYYQEVKDLLENRRDTKSFQQMQN